MTFDEALARGGPLLPAWDDDDTKSRTLNLYEVGPAGARRVARAVVEPAQRDGMIDRLLDRGLRIGQTYGTQPYVWVMDDHGCTIWSDKGVVADGNRDQLTIGGVSTPLKEASRVFSFVDPKDRGHRGVRLELGFAREVTIVEEFDRTPELDPTYGWDNEMLDTMWIFYVGSYLATWLSLAHFEHDRGLVNEKDLLIRRAALSMARDLDRTPPAGPFPDLVRSVGKLPPWGGLALRVAANPQKPELRFLEVRTATPSGATTSVHGIRQGANARIAAFLRDVATPRAILITMNTLNERLKREGYV